jgi:Fic family protein
MTDFKDSTVLKNELQNFRPLSELGIKKLREYDRFEEIYNSNAIEGNTMTKLETKLILEEGMTISGKSIKEHLEVVNLSVAVDFIEEVVRDKIPLTERLIQEIHQIVLQGVGGNKGEAGKYRTYGVYISGSEHLPPNALNVKEAMEKLIIWSETNREKLHPIAYAALLHQKFVNIHPFGDGNGRTARLLMNFALTGAGYPPVHIKATESSRSAYYEALEISHISGDTSSFILLVKKLVDDKVRWMIDNLTQVGE